MKNIVDSGTETIQNIIETKKFSYDNCGLQNMYLKDDLFDHCEAQYIDLKGRRANVDSPFQFKTQLRIHHGRRQNGYKFNNFGNEIIQPMYNFNVYDETKKLNDKHNNDDLNSDSAQSLQYKIVFLRNGKELIGEKQCAMLNFGKYYYYYALTSVHCNCNFVEKNATGAEFEVKL